MLFQGQEFGSLRARSSTSPTTTRSWPPRSRRAGSTSCRSSRRSRRRRSAPQVARARRGRDLRVVQARLGGARAARAHRRAAPRSAPPAARGPGVRGGPARAGARRGAGRPGAGAAVLRPGGRRRGDRLLIVNLGRDLRFASVAEPLLAPPAGQRWRTAVVQRGCRATAAAAPRRSKPTRACACPATRRSCSAPQRERSEGRAA